MTTENICIQKYRHSDREQILKVWERSVAATHHFLDPGDFEEIRKLVHGIDFDQFEVYCLKEDKEVVGFIGLADRKIEWNSMKSSASWLTSGERRMIWGLSIPY